MIPVWVWQKAASPYYYYGTGNEDTTYRMYQLVELAVHRMIPPLPVFFFAVAAALAVFSYLYSAKSANMMHALPVNRLELYVTNYLSGLIFLIVPEIITFFITVLVCLANQFTCIQYLFAALLAQAGVTFFAYSLAVFVAMFTGQAFAMPCYYVIVNYLYVGCMFIVAKVIETISYGIENAWNPGKSCILSPLYYLNNNLRSSLIYTENGNGITGIKITGMPLTGIYAAAAVVLVVAAYQLYKRRQIETAGDWVSIRIIKPVFRWGSTLRRSGRRCHGHIHAHGSAAAAQISVAAALQCGDGLPLFLRGRDAAGKEFQGISQKTRAGVGGDCRDHSGVCIPV